MAQISLKNLMNDNSPTYPADVVQPFRDELTQAGFKELLTPEQVDEALNKSDDKVTLVMLNSVCGCSARCARPAAIFSLLNKIVPDERVTLFAGMEKDAVKHFRETYLGGLTPSSPNIALFKNGKLLHILHRYQIEGKNAFEILKELTQAYDQYCSRINPAPAAEQLRRYIQQKYPSAVEGLSSVSK